MVEQQLYTRSSNGLILKGPGHDTVAVSAGLSLEEAKSCQPYYQYYQSALVNGNGEKYPVVLRQLLPDGGVLMIRMLPRSDQDADGIKQTFLAHGMLARQDDPAYRRQALDVRRMAGITGFVSDYQEGNGQTLPQLTDFPADETPDEFHAVRRLLADGIITKTVLADLACALVTAAETGRRLFLFLPECPDESEALETLQAVFSFVPYSVRLKTGYTTLQCDSGIRDGISVCFLHPSFLNSVRDTGKFSGGDIKKDFVLDLTSGQVLYGNFPEGYQQSDFYDTVRRQAEHPEKIQAFFRFLDEIEKDASLPKLDIPAIDAVFHLMGAVYQFEEPSFFIAAADEISRLSGDSVSPGLENQFCRALEKQTAWFCDKQRLLPDEVTRQALMLYDRFSDAGKDRIFECLSQTVLFSASLDKETFFHLLELCAGNQEVGQMLVSRCIMGNDRAVGLYFAEQLRHYTTIGTMMGYLAKLEQNPVFQDERLLQKEVIQQAVCHRVEELSCCTKQPLEFLLALQEGVRSLTTRVLAQTLSRNLRSDLTEILKRVQIYEQTAETVQTIASFEERNIAPSVLECYGSARLMWRIVSCSQSVISLFGEEFLFDAQRNREIRRVTRWLVRYYGGHEVSRQDFYGILLCCFDDANAVIDFSKAFHLIGDEMLCLAFAGWLLHEMDYLGEKDAGWMRRVMSARQLNSPAEKYVELLNALLKMLSASSGKDSRAARELLESAQQAVDHPEPASNEERSGGLKKMLSMVRRPGEVFSDAQRIFKAEASKALKGREIRPIPWPSAETGRK